MTDDLVNVKQFPKRTEALEKFKDYDVVHVHDDGDLTISSLSDLYVVTTEGEIFKQQQDPPREKVESEFGDWERKLVHNAPHLSHYIIDLINTADLAHFRASTCELGKMIDSLKFVGVREAELITEADKRIIDESKRVQFGQVLGDFLDDFLTRMVKKTLVENCQCKME